MVAIGSVLFSHYKKWSIDLTQYRHYTMLIFNVCGIIYALFMGFIIWDVWERFDDVKRNVHDEVKYLTDLYRDSTVFPESGEEGIQGQIKVYLSFVAGKGWSKMDVPAEVEEGNRLVDQIWESFYHYTPANAFEQIWYTEGIDKLSAFGNARKRLILEGYFDREVSCDVIVEFFNSLTASLHLR